MQKEKGLFVVTLLFCFVVQSVFSQTTGSSAIGQVIYIQKQAKLGPDSTASKDYLSKEMYLVFSQTESMYQQQQQAMVRSSFSYGNPGDTSLVSRDKVNEEIQKRMPMGGAAPKMGSTLYKHFNSNKIITQQIYFDDKYLISDETPAIAWKITDESKVIGEKKCIKAIGDFRGRKYIAWFTPEIPVPTGPWKLNGLPGLILEAADDKNEVIFSFSALKVPTPTPILINKDELTGKAVTSAEYKQEVSKKAERVMGMLKGAGGNVSFNRGQVAPLEL